MHLKLLFIKHTCGRYELTLGIIKEWPNSRGLLFIIIRWWSPKESLCSGRNSSNTCECIKRKIDLVQVSKQHFDLEIFLKWCTQLHVQICPAVLALIFLSVYSASILSSRQNKINKTSGRATEWKKSTALLPDQNSSVVKVTRVNCKTLKRTIQRDFWINFELITTLSSSPSLSRSSLVSNSWHPYPPLPPAWVLANHIKHEY